MVPPIFLGILMKTFFTYEQQIDKLKTDGLIINNEELTREQLRLEGYYNIINGYSPIFKNGARFLPNTTFDHINSLYEFDRRLRIIVYQYTSSVENHFKAILAHEFSRIHGVDEKTYLSTSSFTTNANAVDSINKLITDCNQTVIDALNINSHKYREYIAHNYNVHGHVPLWVLIRALSFGTASIFYKNMIESEKTGIALQYNITANQLTNILEIVVSFRNIVAHGERTFCARLPKARLTPKLKIVKSLCLKTNNSNDSLHGRNDFLSLLICCKYMLPPLEFTGLITEITMALDYLSKRQEPQMFGKIKTAMGLKTNSWKNLPKLKIV